MIYQAGKRNTRWRLPGLCYRLWVQVAHRYSAKYCAGVTGVFYEKDLSEQYPHMALASIAGRVVSDYSIAEENTAHRLQTQERCKHGLLDSTGIDIAMQAVSRVILNRCPLMLETARGEKIHKQDYQGKVSLVNFWASWCGPCVEEIPSLNRLREKMADKPFRADFCELRRKQCNHARHFSNRMQVDFPVYSWTARARLLPTGM